jgi:hypothetical protein
LTIFPSLTAITGEPCLAKMLVPVAPDCELIVIAAFELLTRCLASLVTELSAYLAGAATGKCPSTRPVSAPISCVGIPPISFARSSTDCTYHHAWLYE